MALHPIPVLVCELFLLALGSATALRGPRVMRWLRVALAGLGIVLLDGLVQPLLVPVGGWLGTAPLALAVAAATVVAASAAAATEVASRRDPRQAAGIAVAALTTTLLTVPSSLAAPIGGLAWVAATASLAIAMHRAAWAEPGSLLAARLRTVAVAMWLLASASLSLVAGTALLRTVPLVAGTVLLWLAATPPPFLQLVVSPTRALLRGTDRELVQLGDAAGDTRRALDGIRRVFGADAVLLVDRGIVIADQRPDRGVEATEAAISAATDAATKSLSGVSSTERYDLARRDDRWVLTAPTGRGWLIVVLTEVGLLLTRQDREHIASLAERVGLALERAEARRRDQQAASSMRAVERMRDDLLATVSHELRTPLTSIRGFTEVLREHSASLSETQRRDLLDRVVGKSVELERVVAGLLDLSAVRGRSEPDRVGLYDLADLVERAVGRARNRLDDRPVAVSVDRAEVHTDGGAVLAVIDQLLDNASKFTPHGTQITITGHTSGEDATLVVTDAGPGLGDLRVETAFDAFVRGGDVLQRETRGVGIGLTIARELAAQLGGDLQVLPVRVGAAFSFSFPVVHELADAGEGRRQSARAAEGDPTLLRSDEESEPDSSPVTRQ